MSTAPYGPLTIGRITLTEPVEVSSGSGDTRTLTLSGLDADQVFAHPTQGEIRARAEALLSYSGVVVPVRFTALPHLDGWYRIGSPGADEFSWYDVTAVEWSLDLTLVATAASGEFESALVGGSRIHTGTATPVLWHAAPVGHDAYMVGSSAPGYVARTGADGVVLTYLSLPAGGNPRWGVPLASYLAGAASVTVGGTLLAGVSSGDTPASWALSNGLLRVEPRAGTGTLLLTGYLTSGWGTPKAFDVKRNGVSLGAAQHITVLRNDPCETAVRLTWDHAPGRSTLDLALARGARHVTVVAQQSNVAGPWRIDDNGGGGTVSDQLTASGYIASTTSDADGDRWVIGATVASAAAGTFGLAASSPAAALSGYIGCVRAGASAVSGDAAADVNAQYLGQPAESERLVLR